MLKLEGGTKGIQEGAIRPSPVAAPWNEVADSNRTLTTTEQRTLSFR